MRALAVANLRYWPTVAPVMWRELARWRETASEIGDPVLRALAMAKLTDEAFNAEVAATLATLAPRVQRETAVKAIVALEVLFDYLDGRTEQWGLDAGSRSTGEQDDLNSEVNLGRDLVHSQAIAQRGRADIYTDAVREGERLYAAFAAAVDGKSIAERAASETGGEHKAGDVEYLGALSHAVYEQASKLPGFAAVANVACTAAVRCGQAQARLHVAAVTGDGALEEWARRSCSASGLGWREFVGGAASSVLAMHALIAAAASESVSELDALRIDAAYVAIGAVITTLDSLVDEEGDALRGELGYIRLFESRSDVEERLVELVSEALARAQATPNGEHHAMTLAGIAAYYTTHPGARSPAARPAASAVRRELAPTIWPALGVMRCWRAGKSARARVRPAAGASAASPPTGEPGVR